MKKLLLFTAIAAFLSCSSDDTNQIENQPIYTPKGKLKIIENIMHKDSVRSEDGIVTRFPYDAFIYNEYIYGQNKFVIKEIQSSERHIKDESRKSVIEYSYINDKLHSKESFTNDRFINGKYYTYTGELITKEESGSQITNFIYNSNNELVREEVFKIGYTKPRAIYDYIYENGNVVSVSLTMNDTTTKETFKYDDKKNPYKEMYPEAFLKVLRIGKNNPINDQYREYLFQYNSDEYPIKRSTNDNHSDSTFEYFK